MNGHEHEHHNHDHHQHSHDESCSCGLHDHNHDHHHNHGETCGCEQEDAPGVIRVEVHLHDEARVISGRMTVTGVYGDVKETLTAQLEALAGQIAARGGIVGHIKASCSVKTVDMYSITDTEAAVTVKTAPEQEIALNMAAIVFLVEPQEAEKLVTDALTAVRDAAGV